jgi:FtsH-binding integral membrane protein
LARRLQLVKSETQKKIKLQIQKTKNMKKEINTMKKILAIAAILFAGALVAQANTTVNHNEIPIGVLCENSEFVVVEFASLSEEVQTAIKSEVEKEGFKIKEVAQHKENKDLKVVIISDENAEQTFFFCEKGKLKENKE